MKTVTKFLLIGDFAFKFSRHSNCAHQRHVWQFSRTPITMIFAIGGRARCDAGSRRSSERPKRLARVTALLFRKPSWVNQVEWNSKYLSPAFIVLQILFGR